VKKIAIIFIGLFLIILVIILMKSFSISINSKSTGNSNKALNPSPSSSNNLKAKENTEGSVTVAITQLNLTDNSPRFAGEAGSSTLDFEIVLDTHSGVLDADLIGVSELVDDQGEIYRPIAWEGDGPEGHHRKGVLKFKPILPKPKSIELKIKNVGGIPERSFKWSI